MFDMTQNVKTGTIKPLHTVIGVGAAKKGGRGIEALKAKLRRLARAAKISNPLILAPWTIPSAWAISTVVYQGEVRSNGGSWYVCIVAGTTASSGGGPSVTTNGDRIADGTAYWTYLGPAEITANDSRAPSLTITTTNPVGTLGLKFAPVDYPGVYRAYGGTPVTRSGTGWQLNTFNKAAATVQSNSAKVAFRCDGNQVAIQILANMGIVRFLIDGRYYNPTSYTPGASDTWFIFDFTNNGGRRMRDFVIEGSVSALWFAAVRCATIDNVMPPTTADDVRAIFISDSIWAGSTPGPYLAGGSAPSRIAKWLGWSDPWNMSTPGSGYLNTVSNTVYTFGQRIADSGNAAIIATADIILLKGSTNDIGYGGGNSDAAVTAAVTAALTALRALNDHAPIIVFGLKPTSNAGVPGTETAVHAGVTAFSDPIGQTVFIPLYGNSPLPQITGSWNNSANTSSANNVMYIAAYDGVHGADIGTAYEAQWEADAIRTQFLGLDS
jgi:hypothetical protein